MKKKIYMAGVGGMLGKAFYEEFKNDYDLKCTDKDVNEEWLSFLDFRDYDAYKKDVEAFKPDYLFHIGALTDLEYQEKNPDDAYMTNTIGVENAVYIANALDIPLLYICTAGIFDGSKEIFNDWDQPNPLCVYAKTKYYGECFVKAHAKRYLICRAGWMMGAGPKKDKKFVQKIMQQLKDGKKELFIVNDKQGTPTYTVDFAKNARLLLEKELWGLYNMVCPGETDRYEVAAEMLKILGLENEVKITKVDSSYFAKEYFAPRPSNERLEDKRLNLRGLNVMRPWKEALKDYLTKDYKDYLK